GGAPRQNRWRAMAEVPPETDESRSLSRELKARGFTFVGPTICYAFMQAVGGVNDHLVSCFRHGQLGGPGGRARRAWRRSAGATRLKEIGGRGEWGRGVPRSRDLRLCNLDQLDVEDQHALGLAGRAAVGQVLGDPEAPRLAFDHQRDAFAPTRDHLVEAKER